MPNLDELPDVANLAAPLYLLLIAIEAFAIQRGRARGLYEGRDTATSLSMGVGSVVAGALLGGLSIGIVTLAYQFRITTLPVSLATVALCFVLYDLKYYWSHRFMHRVRWFWAAHVAHHSSQRYNLGTALRQPWTGPISGLALLSTPLALLGFQPSLIFFVASLNLIYQFWIHTEAIDRLPGWVEAVFNTPSHHRVHHGKNPRYLDANYAGTFIVWDRLFRSFVPEQREETVRYGLVHDLDTYNPLRVAFHEYVDIARDLWQPGLSALQRLAYVFAPPGWSHDRSRATSTDLKAAYLIAHPEAAGAPGLTRAAARRMAQAGAAS
jgi:sterol desaturase/sphingolipid hydroxylase (fatty acid hydroxylase superfamily)